MSDVADCLMNDSVVSWGKKVKGKKLWQQSGNNYQCLQCPTGAVFFDGSKRRGGRYTETIYLGNSFVMYNASTCIYQVSFYIYFTSSDYRCCSCTRNPFNVSSGGGLVRKGLPSMFNFYAPRQCKDT
jgi:hypothetical protein